LCAYLPNVNMCCNFSTKLMLSSIRQIRYLRKSSTPFDPKYSTCCGNIYTKSYLDMCIEKYLKPKGVYKTSNEMVSSLLLTVEPNIVVSGFQGRLQHALSFAVSEALLVQTGHLQAAAQPRWLPLHRHWQPLRQVCCRCRSVGGED
jgi:hypothetical protein